MNKSTVSVIKLVKISYFVIILLSQTVVRIISRQPFFFIIRYSFPTYLTFLSNRKTPETQGFWGILRLDTTLSCDNKSIFRLYYSMIVATRPDPTVRPPSRIANVRPCSIATGWIMSIVISTLSPGMHISVPSGRVITPVTSVVRK